LKRFILVQTVMAIMVAMMAASAMPAFAQGKGPSACKNGQPGDIISRKDAPRKFSGGFNPGNAKVPAPPFVSFLAGCNPNDLCSSGRQLPRPPICRPL
jgi:hypothetical protein